MKRRNFIKGVMTSSVVVKTRMIHNSSATLMPFPEALHTKKSEPVSIVEKKNGVLFVDEKKVTEVSCLNHTKRNISAEVLDRLVADPALWPESWKGEGVYVLFCGDEFKNKDTGKKYVRFGYWDENLLDPNKSVVRSNYTEVGKIDLQDLIAVV